MYNHVQHAHEKWGGKLSAIDNWLAERKQLLVAYYQIAGINVSKELLEKTEDSHLELLNAFCEVLMDYISAGHFEIFDMLVAGKSDGEQIREKLYPQLMLTTDAALKFNDTFTSSNAIRSISDVQYQINDLGEILEERFALEDQLISYMAEKREKRSLTH